jgi:hypothetical protein
MSGSVLDAIAHPTQVNPLAAYAQALQVSGAMNQNALFKSRQASGQAFLSSIDPTTGMPNQPKLMQNLAANPNTALTALETSSNAQGLDNATFDTHQKRLTGMNAAAMALSAQYPDGVPQQAVNDEIDRVGPVYGLTAQQMAQAKSSFGADPVANTRVIIRNGIANLTAQEALHASRPGVGNANMGGNLIGTTQAPVAAGPGAGVITQAGPGLPVTLSPSEKINPQPVMGPDNVPGTQPVGAKFDAYGNLRQPGASANAAPAGFTPTALGAGVGQQIETNQTAYNTAQTDLPLAVNRVAGLQKAYTALKQINSGPGSGTWNNIRSTIQSLPVINGFAKPELGEEDSIANYDSARKWMQDYSNRATVGNTAEGLRASQHANASTDISQGASFDVLRTNIGLERMGMAQTRSLQNPQTAIKDAADFATKYDRRAFAADMYTPDQLQKLYDGMGTPGSTKQTAAQEKFLRSLAVAKASGQLQMPGQ